MILQEVLFDLDKVELEIKDLEKEQQKEDFCLDTENAQKVSSKLKRKQNMIQKNKAFLSRIDDLETMTELVEMELDEDEAKELEVEIAKIENELEKYRLETLFKGKYDSLNAILTLHAGAGGTEAQDWTQMLFRMYSRFVEKSDKYALTVLDLLDGDEAGYKSITFRIEGDNAYGFFKAEKGVHRLVRISPFDANKRRHTSFASLEVMPEIIDNDDIVIRPEDLKVDTYRSSGAGGQHVNKTSSAVRMTHIPTGIIVQCQNERSQIQNRETALNMLKGKLAELKERKQQEEAQSIQGDLKKIEWGSQIRSYVFCPYTMVKDHRTNYETGNIQAVMDGDIEDFIYEYLKRS